MKLKLKDFTFKPGNLVCLPKNAPHSLTVKQMRRCPIVPFGRLPVA